MILLKRTLDVHPATGCCGKLKAFRLSADRSPVVHLYDGAFYIEKMVNAFTFFAVAIVCKVSAVGADSPKVQAGMVVGKLRVAPASGRNAMIGIGNDPDQFQIGIDGSGEFIIASPRKTILSVDNEDTMRIYANLTTRDIDAGRLWKVR
ncbi:uncharacterized protein EMH_0095100 [Eimeria mitis]|uniref:Uncharacterized protein n=1 Tax=Eimeria mitis TaxID=44415 RepID=U6KFM0_9EIME|nr:uncharacterized protein EMH_0095100 [Eimeria mitis]CDJ36744.1 hypothetical protein, conserved [Eimeria mitis]